MAYFVFEFVLIISRNFGRSLLLARTKKCLIDSYFEESSLKKTRKHSVSSNGMANLTSCKISWKQTSGTSSRLFLLSFSRENCSFSFERSWNMMELFFFLLLMKTVQCEWRRTQKKIKKCVLWRKIVDSNDDLSVWIFLISNIMKTRYRYSKRILNFIDEMVRKEERNTKFGFRVDEWEGNLSPKYFRLFLFLFLP